MFNADIKKATLVNWALLNLAFLDNVCGYTALHLKIGSSGSIYFWQKLTALVWNDLYARCRKTESNNYFYKLQSNFVKAHTLYILININKINAVLTRFWFILKK